MAYNKLDFRKNMLLANWLTERYEKTERLDASYRVIAEEAAGDLGFDLSGAQISRVCKELGIKPIFTTRKKPAEPTKAKLAEPAEEGGGMTPLSIEELATYILYLEGKIDTLTSRLEDLEDSLTEPEGD